MGKLSYTLYVVGFVALTDDMEIVQIALLVFLI
jgi:hypothetical protein